MKGNAKQYVSTAQQFFTAYDAHDVDGMLGLCADGALGRYAPYGRESVVPLPAEVPGVAKKGQNVHIPHCYILRFDSNSKVTRLDAYWDNTVLNSIKASGV
jgi:hypothetical protein